MTLKKFFAAAAAVCMLFCVTGCTQNDVSTGQEETTTTAGTILPKVKEEETESETVSETTSAPQNVEINIETLAEGEERDYKIEDILKNNLEIDGIPVSIPCTLNELLEALGDDYSVDEEGMKDDINGEVNIESKYFTGTNIITHLYFKGEDTGITLHMIADPEKIDFDTINVIRCQISIMETSVQGVGGLSTGDSVDKYLDKYGNPNEISVRRYFTSLIYRDNDGFIIVDVDNDEKDIIFLIRDVGLESEELFY
ncbi:MAG: hypothetical protein NC085_10990 [Muribaculaceae bacterium]|nr:hypothetical protein [Muribaculaceae bacterium]MCM1480221.1 hypothetical protein [Muribaculaceae bacterium]